MEIFALSIFYLSIFTLIFFYILQRFIILIFKYQNSGKKLEIYMSILIFLKFLHSVVPTIQYDFTMDINF